MGYLSFATGEAIAGRRHRGVYDTTVMPMGSAHINVFRRKLRNFPQGLRDRYAEKAHRWREVTVPAIISPWHVNILPAHAHMLLFHAVPKVASSTLRFLMLELNGLDTHRMSHDTMTRLAQERYLRPFVSRMLRYRKYRRFCFVRNPWSRLASCYRDQVLKRRARNQPFFLGQYSHVDFANMAFAEFVRFVAATSERNSNHHFRSQHYFLCGGKMDFIGRYERFGEDLERVVSCYRLPARFAAYAPRRINAGGKMPADYRSYYDDETRMLVAQRYARDIDLFGYAYDS